MTDGRRSTADDRRRTDKQEQAPTNPKRRPNNQKTHHNTQPSITKSHQQVKHQRHPAKQTPPAIPNCPNRHTDAKIAQRNHPTATSNISTIRTPSPPCRPAPPVAGRRTPVSGVSFGVRCRLGTPVIGLARIACGLPIKSNDRQPTTDGRQATTDERSRTTHEPWPTTDGRQADERRLTTHGRRPATDDRRATSDKRRTTTVGQRSAAGGRRPTASNPHGGRLSRGDRSAAGHVAPTVRVAGGPPRGQKGEDTPTTTRLVALWWSSRRCALAFDHVLSRTSAATMVITQGHGDDDDATLAADSNPKRKC